MEKITVKVTCPRCGGRGLSEAWKFTGLTCWQCGGEGYVWQEQKVYTPEEQAKRDAREAKRIAKAQAEFEATSKERAIAQAERELREYRQSRGFANREVAYVVKGQDRLDRETLKAEGAKYNDFLGWNFDQPHATIETAEVTYSQLRALYEANQDEYAPMNAIANTPASKGFVGTVGEKISLTAKAIGKFNFERKSFSGFGTEYVTIYKWDCEGKLLVWLTTSFIENFEIGKTYKISATVKAHSEYDGEDQTQLSRVKAKLQ